MTKNEFINEFINLKLEIKKKEAEAAKMDRELTKLKPNIKTLLNAVKGTKCLVGINGVIAREDTEVRTIDTKKFQKLVPDSTFHACIKVGIGEAEKYMEKEDINKICTTALQTKLHVCKDMVEFVAKMEKNKKKYAIKATAEKKMPRKRGKK